MTDSSDRDHCATTLFDQTKAESDRYTARLTIYSANIAAGLMLHQFAHWLRNRTMLARVRGVPLETIDELSVNQSGKHTEAGSWINRTCVGVFPHFCTTCVSG